MKPAQQLVTAVVARRAKSRVGISAARDKNLVQLAGSKSECSSS